MQLLLWPDWISSCEFLCFLKQALLDQAKQAWQKLLSLLQERKEDEWHDNFTCMQGALKE